MMGKTATCKRCGSNGVGWVQSKRTGRYYLALATPTHSIQIGGSVSGQTGYQLHPQTPHDCTDQTRGGFKRCEFCGRHHYTRFGLPDADECARHPDAR